jgi:hypothetical protein
MKNYGVENPSQSKIINDRKIETTMKNYNVSHHFKSDIIKENIKQTCLFKYGVENPSQNIDIARKKRNKFL